MLFIFVFSNFCETKRFFDWNVQDKAVHKINIKFFKRKWWNYDFEEKRSVQFFSLDMFLFCFSNFLRHVLFILLNIYQFDFSFIFFVFQKKIELYFWDQILQYVTTYAINNWQRERTRELINIILLLLLLLCVYKILMRKIVRRNYLIWRANNYFVTKWLQKSLCSSNCKKREWMKLEINEFYVTEPNRNKHMYFVLSLL